MGCIQSPPSSQQVDETEDEDVSNENNDQVVPEVLPTSGVVSDEKKEIEKKVELAVSFSEDVIDVDGKKQYNSTATLIDENDKETGLQSESSLMKSLSSSLQMENDDWVLCLIEIDSDGDTNGDNTRKQVGTIIKKYVSIDPSGRKGYRLFDSKYNRFGIFMNCSKLGEISIRMKTLMNHIKNNCATTVFVGIAKMDLTNDCHSWKKRAIDNLNVAKSSGRDSMYSDIPTNANKGNEFESKLEQIALEELKGIHVCFVLFLCCL